MALASAAFGCVVSIWPILLEKLAYTRKICVAAIKTCGHSDEMTIHDRIKERRLAMGLGSHRALADLVGVSWQTVQLWEKEGGTAPNRSRIEKVAQVLGVTPEWLQHGVDTAKDTQRPVRSVDVARPQQPPPRVSSTPPKWIDGEAFRLLEFYYLADTEGRERVMRFAEIQANSAAASAVSNER